MHCRAKLQGVSPFELTLSSTSSERVALERERSTMAALQEVGSNLAMFYFLESFYGFSYRSVDNFEREIQMHGRVDRWQQGWQFSAP